MFPYFSLSNQILLIWSSESLCMFYALRPEHLFKTSFPILYFCSSPRSLHINVSSLQVAITLYKVCFMGECVHARAVLHRVKHFYVTSRVPLSRIVRAGFYSLLWISLSKVETFFKVNRGVCTRLTKTFFFARRDRFKSEKIPLGVHDLSRCNFCGYPRYRNYHLHMTFPLLFFILFPSSFY